MRRTSGLSEAEKIWRAGSSKYPKAVKFASKSRLTIDPETLNSPGEWVMERARHQGHEVDTRPLDKDHRAGNLGIYRHVSRLPGAETQGGLALIEKISFLEREVVFYSEYAEELALLDPRASITAEAVFRLSKAYHSIFMRMLPRVRKPKPSLQVAQEMATKISAIYALPTKGRRIAGKPSSRFSFEPERLESLAAKQPQMFEDLSQPASLVEHRLRSIQEHLNSMPTVPCHADLSFGNMMADIDGDEVHLRIIDWGSFGKSRLGIDLRGFLEADSHENGDFARELARSLSLRLKDLSISIDERDLLLSALMAQFSMKTRQYLRSDQQGDADYALRMLGRMLRY